MPTVVVLGSGFVAAPALRRLLQKKFNVIIASLEPSRAEELIAGHPNGRAVMLDIEDHYRLHELVEHADVVISMLPATMHPHVAAACLQHGTHLVTTSYVSPAMQQLDEQARQHGLLFLNECGLDPGIDHMSAMQLIDYVHDNGGTVTSFKSFCGGLPAPASNTNPWGYKFSWSPRGVLLAGLNSAEYRWNGLRSQIPSGKLFHHVSTIHIENLGEFEIYPNRDSMQYAELYGIESAETVFRGTLRYPGWSETMQAVIDLDLLDDTTRPELQQRPIHEIVRQHLALASDTNLREAVAEVLQRNPSDPIMARLEWLGLFAETPVNSSRPSFLNMIIQLMSERMQYRPGEQDMAVLRHELLFRDVEGNERLLCSQLVEFGETNGDFAMAKTVGYPAAIAAELIAAGKMKETGVRIPIHRSIYQPILTELAQLGIRVYECYDSPTA